MVQSDDESSDSSNEFLVNPDSLDFNDSFFKNVASTSKTQQKTPKKSTSDDDTSDDDFVDADTNVDTTTLFSEVMKNLEKSNAAMATCFEQMPSNVLSMTSKTKATDLKEKEHQPSIDLKDEINDLLLKGESSLGSSGFVNNLDNHTEQPASTNNVPSNEDITITLPDTNMMFNCRKKGKVDLQAQLMRHLNKKLQSNQLLVHKVGLLCWLSHGFYLNQIINDPEIMAVTLSLIPSKIYPKGRADIKYVEGFTNWFKKCIKVEFNKNNNPITKDVLLERLKQQKTTNYQELVLLFIAALRAMGLNCRLVISLCPPALKLQRDKLFQVKKEGDVKPIKKIKKITRRKIDNKKKTEDNFVFRNSSTADNVAKDEAKKRAVEFLRSNFQAPEKKKLPRNGNIVVEPDEVKISPKLTRSKARNMALKTPDPVEVETKSKSKVTRSKAKVVAKKDEVKSVTKRKKVDKKDEEVKIETDNEEKTVSESISESKSSLEDENSSEDSDSKNFKRKRKLNFQTTRSSSESTSRKVLSSDDEEEDLIDTRDARHLWVEVYVESEESWISVSVPDNKVHCVADIYKKAPRPFLYTIAWNSGGSIKDVTRRYAPHWLTVTRKQRVDETWWKETLVPWLEPKSVLSKAEDEMLLQMEMEQPLPDAIGKYKGHPLYVLARHLLKYEALYPPDCVPLGYLKNKEPVYSRHCVHTLRSRETWLREARVVKPKQEPYKIVKSLKLDKFTHQIVREPLELFGKWQTDPYDPPVAKDGIVPRNAYGNVDLFQQCMLPKGTVHIDLPGLGRIAKKLNIDCAAAVTGFNFGCRRAMPKTEGYIVCEEYEETLREAWEAEQVAATKRAREKRDKKIWGSWRRLIRGLLIKEKLALRYNMKDEDDDCLDKDDDRDDEADKKDDGHKRKKIKKN
ncbi:DNA repair protein complementing XP-C cells [Chelonus insularis]|uniref:DNA repair protein complementing XP-C cells n=1 Tax=Chelonus insularis TaxID=460826 RepID=UPI00158EA7DD|nr:DNA repair protein complementing XP-C cells [Chelonus insularis]